MAVLPSAPHRAVAQIAGLHNNEMKLTKPRWSTDGASSQLISVLGEPLARDKMRITYRATQADLVHAARAWEGRHWSIARYVVAASLLACGAFLILGAGVWWGGVFVLLSLLEALNLLPAAVLRAMIEYRANPKFREEFQLTLTPEGLHFRTPSIDSALKWDLYSDFFETAKAFILVYGKRMYTVIPKRALDGDAQLRELRELLSGAIRDRAGRLTSG